MVHGNQDRYNFGDNEWVLKSITDPSGNKTELLYGGEPGELKVTQVRDASGRTLDFEYERISSPYPVLTERAERCYERRAVITAAQAGN